MARLLQAWLAVLLLLLGVPTRAAELTAPEGVRLLPLSPDGARLARVSDSKDIQILRSHDGGVLQTLRGHTDVVEAVVFAADGQTLASASRDRTVRFWDLANGKELHRLPGHDWGNVLAISPDGKVLAAAAWDNQLRLYQVATRRQLRAWKLNSTPTFLEFSPDGSRLACKSWGPVLSVWDVASRASNWRMKKPRPS